MIVFKALENNAPIPSDLENIVKDCSKLVLSLVHMSFNYIFKSVNLVVNLVAKKSHF